ncbi:ImmA/IrrE family metallo-endopeptidase [Hyphomicrobium sp. 2TAF46]|uniref:ImmA/IrrE family metallo-endopeptidase n=1 Tax=Hyphomicrobium sp. 2TAF46 TaxID=3233019 RepID=UPI003F914C45
MTKADDCSLDPEQLRAVELKAKNLLDRAEAWGVLPTPVDIILEAAKVKLAPTKAFDPARIMAYLQGKAASVVATLRSGLSKVFGIYDADDHIIHVDDTVVEAKQTFLKLHETGHAEMPHHRKTFRIFQDCEKSLSPEIANLFEREANNFARFALFQGTTYAQMAADSPMALNTPINLRKKFGASVYASAREFASTNSRECLVIVCEKAEMREGFGIVFPIRRIFPSAPFDRRFPVPADAFLHPDHALGPMLPIGRRRVKQTTVGLRDRNGDLHELVGEALDTTYNTIILIYPVKALTASTIILPPGFVANANSPTGRVV